MTFLSLYKRVFGQKGQDHNAIFWVFKARRALAFHAKGLLPSAISDALAREGLVSTRQDLAKFLQCFKETGSLQRRPGSGSPSKVMPQAMTVVKAEMHYNNETTSVQLCALASRSTTCPSQPSFGAIHLSAGLPMVVHTARWFGRQVPGVGSAVRVQSRDGFYQCGVHWSVHTTCLSQSEIYMYMYKQNMHDITMVCSG